jgi:excisionase family DNA binding protein
MTVTDYRCGLCGEEFGSNCYPGDISCTGCDARLCPCCGAWFTELGDMSVSGMTVYRLIESGELRAKRFGSSYRVREADLNAYVDGADAVTLEPEVAGG